MNNDEVNYSLWLRPEQTQLDEFTEIVSNLAHRFRTKPFPPHITLLSSIHAELDTVKQACTKIVDGNQQFDIPLPSIDYTEAYYRNFYILAEMTPALLNVYEHAKQALSYKTNEEYMPHVSLLYGDLAVETKQSLKEQLEGYYPKIFKCQRLDLYNSTGSVSDWHLIKSYHFYNSKK